MRGPGETEIETDRRIVRDKISLLKTTDIDNFSIQFIFKIRGIFMQADIKNRNGRVYPMEILENEVGKYNKNFIKEKRK